MLSTSMRIAILLAIAVYFCLLVILLKQKRLALRYTLLWLFSGFVMLILTAFPNLLRWITGIVGMELQSNALFAILFFCVLIILVSMTSIASKQNEYIKRLVQQTAQLEKRILEFEAEREIK